MLKNKKHYKKHCQKAALLLGVFIKFKTPNNPADLTGQARGA